jgi:non-heme chloroperoxidase
MERRFFCMTSQVACMAVFTMIGYAEGPPAWKDPSPHRARMVRVSPAVQLEVLDWGGAGRPLVLLAGSGHSAHVFDDIAPRMRGFAHVYGVTRRGYGNSSQPESGYEEQQLADDVWKVIEALRLKAPVLVGHSMAGGEITTLGTQHSDRLGGLVYLDALGDPRDFPASDRAYRALLERLPAAIRNPPAGAAGDDDRTFEAYRRRQQAREHFAFPESELRTGFATNADGTMGRFRTPSRIHQAIGEGQRKRDYRGIRVPVLALVDIPDTKTALRPGDYVPRNDEERRAVDAVTRATAVFVNRWIEQLRAAVPSAQVVNMPGAGHMLFLTRSSEVIEAMRQFVGHLK